MITIEAEFVLAHYFSIRPDNLSFGKLRRLRVAIESKFAQSVRVDVSTPSLASAIEMYPNWFKWDRNDIVKNGEIDALDHFDLGLPADVADQARAAIVEFCERTSASLPVDRVDLTGDQMRLVESNKCPHCGSKDIAYDLPVVNWELIGEKIRLYGHCNKCTAPWVLIGATCEARFKW